MEWLEQVAGRLRGLMSAAPWLDDWQSSIKATPDWTLVAGVLGALLLLAILLLVRAPRGTRAAKRPDIDEAQFASAAPSANAKATAHRSDLLPTAKSSEVQPASRVRRASGVPDENEQERKARVFLSSTFRDMRAEREVLATDIFPSLKRRFRARGVEVQEVDLRWGVNEGDAALEVCLQAVRRSNWFVGLIGQRYGTTLEDKATVAQLGPDYPAVADGLGRSLTEIEILEGVLLKVNSDKEIFFFERDAAWIDTRSPTERLEYEEQSLEAQAKLSELKARIRARVGVMHAYPAPAGIGGVFMQIMSDALERAFPLSEDADDPFMQEHGLHAAYARERLGLYIGGEDYFGALDAGMQEGHAPQLIIGQSGGGKSALIANWLQKWHAAHPCDVIFAHYLGASPESAAPAALVRRLWLHLNAVSGEAVAPPDVDATQDDLANAVLHRLSQANAFAVREDCCIVIALDGFDKLAEDHRDLRWWPRALPPRIRLVASSLDGKARDAGRQRGWSEILLKPFDAAQQGQLIADTLKSWNKSDFPEPRRRWLLGHKLAGLPLFLKTILEELRISATNDALDARLDGYLKAPDIPDLYARILAQIESECGKDFVAQALSLIWASRAGLEEDEIIAIVAAIQHVALGPTGLAWERLRNRLADNLRDSQGRVAFSHDYLRQAVEEMYLPSEDARQKAHLVIADRFAAREPDQRHAEELPFQLHAAQAWVRLEALLVDLDRFELLRARGDAELLSYWLPLKERDRQPEALLVAAFEARAGGPEQWLETEIKLAFELGSFLFFAGATGDACQRLGERRSAACVRILGPEHPDTIRSMLNLASTMRDRGDLEAAQGLEERALAAWTRILGPEHPATLTSMLHLASTLRDRGDLEAAQELEERVLAARTRILGPEHPETLGSMNNLASTLAQRGDLEAAQELEERVLATWTRILGAEHPDTITSMNNLALTLYTRGDLESAQGLEERVLAARTQLLGTEHPDTLASANNLASILADKGDLEAAQELEERVLTAWTRILGPEHPSTITSMNNLASTLHARGDLESAQKLHEQVVATWTRLLGPEHPSTLTSMANLAETLRTRGDTEGAQELEKRVLTARVQILGAEHPDTISGMNNLALTLYTRGDLESAQELQERVLAAWTRISGPEHPNTLGGMASLAETFRARGDLEGALERAERVLSILTLRFGIDHPTSKNASTWVSGIKGEVAERTKQ